MTESKSPNKKVLFLRIPVTLYDKVSDAAAEDDRTLNREAIHLIKKGIKYRNKFERPKK